VRGIPAVSRWSLVLYLKPQFESPQVPRVGSNLPFDLPGCSPSYHVAPSHCLPRRASDPMKLLVPGRDELRSFRGGEVFEAFTVLDAMAYQLAYLLVRLGKRHARPGNFVCQVRGGEKALPRSSFHPLRANVQRLHHTGRHAQRRQRSVNAIEERCLVLLQVPAVGYWQALQQGDHPQPP